MAEEEEEPQAASDLPPIQAIQRNKSSKPGAAEEKVTGARGGGTGRSTAEGWRFESGFIPLCRCEGMFGGRQRGHLIGCCASLSNKRI